MFIKFREASLHLFNVNNKIHALEFEMDRIINLGIPHIGETIFENIDTDELCQYFFVSQTWKVLAENVLLKGAKANCLRHVQVERRKLCSFFWNNMKVKLLD